MNVDEQTQKITQEEINELINLKQDLEDDEDGEGEQNKEEKNTEQPFGEAEIGVKQDQ